MIDSWPHSSNWRRNAALFACLLLTTVNTIGDETEDVPAAGVKKEIPAMARCRQMILSLAPDWDHSTAMVRCYERKAESAPWVEVHPVIPATTGRNGLAWGIGLHGTWEGAAPVKRERDGRAPAGVFGLAGAFGYANPRDACMGMFPYEQITMSHRGVDDIHSRYYNRIIDSELVPRDWDSAEVMKGKHTLYRWGLVVEQNWKPYPGYGSCIFLHVWQRAGVKTSGCTAMAAGDLQWILHWLDKTKRPLFVQLPIAEYECWKEAWRLP